ncbi:MAG: LysM peptidoglycan-binding domain-containing protein [Lachnospiraceae bacterium]|nr:LysM peptidoglycan-binding domain-containing protein [Lachnospiraceae bacterium]
MRRNYSKRVMNRLKSVCVIAVGVVLLCVLCSSFVDAHNDREKYYTSVLVEPGDTLWSLANEYGSEEYRDNHDYIKEVKQINHITCDDIHEGSYILVPYYD